MPGPATRQGILRMEKVVTERAGDTVRLRYSNGITMSDGLGLSMVVRTPTSQIPARQEPPAHHLARGRDRRGLRPVSPRRTRASLPFAVDPAKVTVEPGLSYTQSPIKAHDYGAGVMGVSVRSSEHNPGRTAGYLTPYARWCGRGGAASVSPYPDQSALHRSGWDPSAAQACVNGVPAS